MNHLAIMYPKYLNLIRKKIKSIETRATIPKITPYHEVHESDIIYFKASGRPIIDLKATVEKPEYYEGEILFVKMREYQKEIGIDEEYINSKSRARYLSMFWLIDVTTINPPISIIKNDMRPWIADYDPGREYYGSNKKVYVTL